MCERQLAENAKENEIYGCDDHLSERWVRFGAAWAMRERSILPVVEP